MWSWPMKVRIKEPPAMVAPFLGNVLYILLIEPAIIKSLLNKYAIASWAVNRDDDYYNIQQ